MNQQRKCNHRKEKKEKMKTRTNNHFKRDIG